jgi:hypothetical protein
MQEPPCQLGNQETSNPIANGNSFIYLRVRLSCFATLFCYLFKVMSTELAGAIN